MIVTMMTMHVDVSAQANVPLIDREVFFGNPEISSGTLSPDGKYVAFMKEHEGIMNVWVKAFDEPFSAARLLTESASPILGFAWSRDGSFVLYANDKAGDENINIFAVDPSGSSVENLVPESRNLTPLDEVTAQIYNVSKKDKDLIWIGLNDRDKAWHDLYTLKISTGELVKKFENTDRFTGWNFDWDENLRLANRTDENGHSQIMRVDGPGEFTEIYKTDLSESAYVAGWTPDNKYAYLVSNKGDVNLSTLYKMDPATGETEVVESDPAGKVDFGSMMLDDNTREILWTSYTADKTQRHFKDAEWEKRYEYLKNKFPGREVGFTSFTDDYTGMLISVSGDKYATEVHYYNAESGDVIKQYTPRPELKEIEDYLSTMEPVSYKSSDGMTITGYLSLPVGVEAKNLPVVMFIHGGPKGPRDYWGYNSRVQMLTNRGYAVLQPNFRASGGYGKEFLNAGDKEWGRKMQDDITWGVKYLIQEGIADPDRVAIMGGSYGGYATLAGLAFTPDVYACGIDIVGPSNLFTLLESIPPYWEAGRKWLYEMVGDPDTEEGAALLKERSPLFSADNINKPLMVVQGANDPRVKQAESDQIVMALRDKGADVVYLNALDEGHGYRKPLNRMAMWAASEKFLAQHLGGRYQEDVPDDVRETLEKITVDVNSVTLEEKKDVDKLTALPEIKMAPKAGTYSYAVSIEAGGQKIPMEMTRTISQNGDTWTIADAVQSAMGPMSDEADFNSALAISERRMSQGGQNMSINYDGMKASMNVMGNTIPVEADGLIISDGPGLDHIVANLGLEVGEEVAVYSADMMKGKATEYVLTLVGEEGAADGSAGKVHKYTMTASDNAADVTTLWINPETAMATKMTKVIPAMGNAVRTVTMK